MLQHFFDTCMILPLLHRSKLNIFAKIGDLFANMLAHLTFLPEFAKINQILAECWPVFVCQFCQFAFIWYWQFNRWFCLFTPQLVIAVCIRLLYFRVHIRLLASSPAAQSYTLIELYATVCFYSSTIILFFWKEVRARSARQFWGYLVHASKNIPAYWDPSSKRRHLR